ncbi:MAG: hypothetical protein EPO35_12370 [Acidobacteria bacterium]|nr:MAG: hypothetical protein EPO35_12370 [Acidobacteriota bacterium]
MSVTPSFGVSALTSFAFSGSASDPDGDAITYGWSYGSASASGATATTTIAGDGTVAVRLTVTDSKGATGTDTRNVTIGTVAGTWRATLDRCPSSGNPNAATGFMTYTMTQTSSGVLAGTFVTGSDWCSVTTGTTGNTDNADSNTINASAQVRMRIKVGAFIDFVLNGTMDSTGRRMTLAASGSGLDGATFTWTKQ